MRIRSGTSTRFWTDNWSPFGCLQSFLENDSNFSLGIQDDATVSSLYRDKHCLLPNPRSDKQLQLHVFLTTLGKHCVDCNRNWRVRLILLTWQSCIYWTWQERNSRLHRNTFRSTDGLLRLIDRQIRDRILSYRERNPRSSSSRMMQQWLV
ncbi:hypothetical protein HID58_067659 [Brassica napus]|uniref:Reverse transcriptase zinc-binding domain-containing protein n=1 Tax=Brassica napus TaxID=3708 RepID=A0ABQ7ZJ55_BRANA|nr:hypothetical protein HID58_067659 [Brassica napus]